MEELSTKNNLVRFLYQETTLTEDARFSKNLAADSDLQKEYDSLKKAQQQLPKVLFNPSPSVLDKILKYSRTTATEHFC